MAKYKHQPDTLIALRDIENRFIQLLEANQRYQSRAERVVAPQNTAIQSCLTVVRQVIDHGHVMRGNEYFPDALLPYVTTPSVTEQLGVKAA